MALTPGTPGVKCRHHPGSPVIPLRRDYGPLPERWANTAHDHSSPGLDAQACDGTLFLA